MQNPAENDVSCRLIQLYVDALQFGSKEEAEQAERALLLHQDINATISGFCRMLIHPGIEISQVVCVGNALQRYILAKDELVRPYCHKLLQVLEPMLIDSEEIVRKMGIDLISALTRAVGLATMIASKRPDIECPDEYIRGITARTMAIVAREYGVTPMMPFLKAVSQAKSPLARHSAMKIIQQLAILMEKDCLPFLDQLASLIRFEDLEQKVCVMSLLAFAALVEHADSGSFNELGHVVTPLWQLLITASGKVQAAAVKACGRLLPLMPSNTVGFYLSEFLPIAISILDATDATAQLAAFSVLAPLPALEGCQDTFADATVFQRLHDACWTPKVAQSSQLRPAAAQLLVGLLAVKPSTAIQRLRSSLNDNYAFQKLSIAVIERIKMTQHQETVEELLQLALVLLQRIESCDTLAEASFYIPSTSNVIHLLGFKAHGVVSCLSVALRRLKPESETLWPPEYTRLRQTIVTVGFADELLFIPEPTQDIDRVNK